MDAATDPFSQRCHPSGKASGERQHRTQVTIETCGHPTQVEGGGPVPREEVVLAGPAPLGSRHETEHDVADVDPVEAAFHHHREVAAGRLVDNGVDP